MASSAERDDRLAVLRHAFLPQGASARARCGSSRRSGNESPTPASIPARWARATKACVFGQAPPGSERNLVASAGAPGRTSFCIRDELSPDETLREPTIGAEPAHDGFGVAEPAAIEQPPPAMATFAAGFCNGLGANWTFQSVPWAAIMYSLRIADTVAMYSASVGGYVESRRPRWS